MTFWTVETQPLGRNWLANSISEREFPVCFQLRWIKRASLLEKIRDAPPLSAKISSGRCERKSCRKSGSSLASSKSGLALARPGSQ